MTKSEPQDPEILVLVPTRLEARLLLDVDGAPLDLPAASPLLAKNAAVALCGCGLAAAGVLAARWLERLRPRRVLLVGLGGTLDPRGAPVGRCVAGSHVTLGGIGAGQGEHHLSLTDMGLEVLPGLDDSDIALAPPPRFPSGGLVSVASASANHDEARAVRAAHPHAVVEDMETWPVALAARLTGTPLTVIRTISNEAGVRDKSAWRLDAAARAFRDSLSEVFHHLTSSPPALPE